LFFRVFSVQSVVLFFVFFGRLAPLTAGRLVVFFGVRRRRFSHHWCRAESPPMKRHRRRKCRHCRELFLPDLRNLRHQHYCSKPACRRASKAASQRRWLSKPANRDYFRGEENVQRVRAWRGAHPRYWQRAARQGAAALQADSLVQAVESAQESPTFAGTALQDLLCAQPFVLIGLIANLTGSRLQEPMPHAA
jgi:hypothetical protein